MTTADYQPAFAGLQPNSPPSKASLASWWERFKKRNGKDIEKDEPQGIFGVPLHQSINYANVAISLTNAEGVSQVYGYVPVVVAKCGVFLKENATDIEGIFRLSGSAKRIKDLQHIFNSPDKYGKGLDWTGYTVHDAANVLRRYLNQLPEPIIPLEFYTRFRDPLTVPPEHFNVDEAIKVYQKLISELPSLNRQLLLYILDLLAVFASRSEHNLMTATNLAAIFQPGLISHPSHDMAPQAYKLSQDVLVFLINHQDHFLLGMQGSNDAAGATEPLPMTPTTPSSHKPSKAVARSSSNASAAADDVRKFGGVRRNVSVSSKKSAGSPVAKTSGVSRSNTLPSRRSPRVHPTIPSFRQNDGPASPKRSAPALVQSTPRRSEEKPVTVRPMSVDLPKSQNFERRPLDHTQAARILLNSPTLERPFEPSGVTTPNRERNFANFFSGLSPGDSERPTRKLRKKRLPGSSNHSAESSTTSLPPISSNSSVPNATSLEAVPGSPPSNSNNQGSRPVTIPAPNPAANSGTIATSASTLMPAMSPTPSATSSVTSQESVPSFSDTTNTSASPENKKARSRWRWSNSKVERWDPPTSPTFGASNGSIAERIRRASRSPPANNRYTNTNSDGSGDESRSSSKSALSWLKRNRDKKDERPGAISPLLTQPAHVRAQAPPSPQVQPPTPVAGNSVSPIPESKHESEHPAPLSTNTSDTVTPRQSVAAPANETTGFATPAITAQALPAQPEPKPNSSEIHVVTDLAPMVNGVGGTETVPSPEAITRPQ